MKGIKEILFYWFSLVDRFLKFPALQKGEVGIQVGFDMTSPITSDLFGMSGRVGKQGCVLGIDPDPWNHRVAEQIIKKRGIGNIRLIELARRSNWIPWTTSWRIRRSPFTGWDT
jgi:hypothetical protein